MRDENHQAGCMNVNVPNSMEDAVFALALQTRLLSCVQEALAAVDENHAVTYWNTKMEQLTGLQQCDVLGKPVREFMRFERQPPADEAGPEGLCNGEYLCRIRGGREIPVRLHALGIQGDDGGFKGGVASFIDLSGEKRRDSIAAFFGDIGNDFSLRTTPGEILQVTGEKTARYLGVSMRLLYAEVDEEKDTLTVLYEQRAPGVPEAGVIFRLSEYIGPEVLRELKAGRVVAVGDVESGERTWGNAGAFDAPGIRSGLIAPYSEGNRLAFVIILQHGEPRRWPEDEAGMLRILAERVFRRVRLARVEDRLAFQASLLSNVQEVVAAVNDKWNVVYWNKAAENTFGWTAGEAIGRLAYELCPINMQDALRNYEISDHLVEHVRFNEVTLFHKNGSRVEADIHTKLMYDAGGRFSGAIFSLRDITKRKMTEEALRDSESRALDLAMQLEEKNRFITDFFINVSHEFKTPLTILMLGLELLENKMKARAGGVDVSRNISVMKQNSYRLNRLVSNLLDITKLDAGFMEPKWETADIVTLLGNLARSTETYAHQKQLTVRFSTNAATHSICTDSFILERIMLNLLSNAIKHTAPGGHIQVRCRVGDGTVTVSVKDNGEGIPESKKDIIFDRFSQVDTSLARASEGSGIGLALTKSFVELMGGRIWFVSTAGVGSEFFVELPAVNRECVQRNRDNGGMQLDKRVQMEFSDIGLSIG